MRQPDACVATIKLYPSRTKSSVIGSRDYRHVLQFPVATVVTYHQSFSGSPSRFSKADARTSSIFADELDSGGFYRPLKLSTRLVRYSRPKTSFEALHSRGR